MSKELIEIVEVICRNRNRCCVGCPFFRFEECDGGFLNDKQITSVLVDYFGGYNVITE